MKKIAIIYGCMENGIQKRALEELNAILLDYTFLYPACIKYGEEANTEDFRCIYIGTKDNNPYIKENSNSVISEEESYSISVKNDTVIIEGFDDAGVLYGVLDFYNKYIVKFEHPDNCRYWVNFFNNAVLPEFEYTSTPSVKKRGLWTWGHVIYDYRDYLHNMMKLKMNNVVIWNDYVPANANEIVEFAHSCNIKVVWGFAWGWDTNCRLFDFSRLKEQSKEIFEKYEREYASLGGDGIYFQTFTELRVDNIDGLLIAEAAAKFVNDTAAIFYEKYPNLELRFGLHATSVKEKLEFIKTVDERVYIDWEDCGAFPFAEIPTEIENFDETKDFITAAALLRGEDDRFGVVTKALVKLDWPSFEHLDGSQCIGVSSKWMKKNRVERKSRIWRYIQAGWLVNSDKAAEMVKHMADLKRGDLTVLALVEDGMFEENIMYPVAVYSEMLWDCNSDVKELLRTVALRRYVDFA